jgi:fatty acid-binding protein DegV
MTRKLETSFVLSTLKYMWRGGRCSGVAALGANVLKLKPCIEMRPDTGKMDVGKKYRGNLEAVLLQYVEDRLKGREDIDARRLFITYTLGVRDELIEKIRARALELIAFEEVFVTVASATISNHSGPGTLGILYAKK